MDFSIDKLATLARIQLQEDEKKALSDDLGNILKYVEQIKELDTDNVAPMDHVLDIENVFREDIAQEGNKAAEKILGVLPDTSKDGRFFRVPKVIEGIE